MRISVRGYTGRVRISMGPGGWLVYGIFIVAVWAMVAAGWLLYQYFRGVRWLACQVFMLPARAYRWQRSRQARTTPV